MVSASDDLRDMLRAEIETTRDRLQKLEEAAAVLEGESGGEWDVAVRRRRGTTDRRTREGRMADEVELSDEELEQMYQDAKKASGNEDGRIDLRTKEGRILRAAGYINARGYKVGEGGDEEDDERDDSVGGWVPRRTGRARKGGASAAARKRTHRRTTRKQNNTKA